MRGCDAGTCLKLFRQILGSAGWFLSTLSKCDGTFCVDFHLRRSFRASIRFCRMAIWLKNSNFLIVFDHTSRSSYQCLWKISVLLFDEIHEVVLARVAIDCLEYAFAFASFYLRSRLLEALFESSSVSAPTQAQKSPMISLTDSRSFDSDFRTFRCTCVRA